MTVFLLFPSNFLVPTTTFVFLQIFIHMSVISVTSLKSHGQKLTKQTKKSYNKNIINEYRIGKIARKMLIIIIPKN